MKQAIFTAALICCATLGFVQATDVPEHRGFVNDNAKVLSPDVRDSLNARLAEFAHKNQETTIAILTMPKLDEDRVGFAVKVYNTWHIRRNGVLLLFVLDPRGLKIEVGHDAEEYIPDGKSGEISRTYFGPFSRAGKYDEAFVKTTNEMMRILDGKFNPPAATTQQENSGSSGAGVALLLVGLVVIGFIVVITVAGRKPRRREDEEEESPPRRRHQRRESHVDNVAAGMAAGLAAAPYRTYEERRPRRDDDDDVTAGSLVASRDEGERRVRESPETTADFSPDTSSGFTSSGAGTDDNNV